MRALRRIVDTDNSDSVEKFFLLYRCDNDLALNALTELSEYYRQSGEDDKTMKCSSLASVMAITKLEKIVRQRINDYEYQSLGDLLSKCAKYEDIVKWGNENNIWKLGWNKNDKGWWYCTDVINKCYYTSKDGWKLIDGDLFIFDENGYALQNTWYHDENDGKDYYLGDDCRIIKR